MSLKRRLLSASALNLADYALKIGVILLASPYIITTLGTAEYGFWVILISLVGYLDLLDLGLSPTGIRYLSRSFSNTGPDTAVLFRHIQRAYRRSAGVALLIGVVAVAVAPYLLDDAAQSRTAQWVLGAGGCITALGYWIRARSVWLKARVLYHRLIVAGIVRLVFGTTITLLLLRAGWGIQGMLWGWTVGMVSELSLIVALSRGECPKSRDAGEIEPAERAEMRRFGGKMILWSLAGLMRERVDTQVLGAHLGSPAAAQYAVGTRLTTIFTDLMNAVFGSHFLAAFSQLHGRGNGSGPVEALKASLRFSVPLGLAAGLSLWVLGPSFIEWWLGEGFEQSHAVIHILALPLALSLAQQPLGTFLGALDQHGNMVRIALWGGAINLLGSLVLVTVMGFEGVEIATACELLVTSLFLWPTLVARGGFMPLAAYLRLLLRPLALLAPVAGTAWLVMHQAGSPQGLTGIATYSCLLLLALGLATWFLHFTSQERSWILHNLKLQGRK